MLPMAHQQAPQREVHRTDGSSAGAILMLLKMQAASPLIQSLQALRSAKVSSHHHSGFGFASHQEVELGVSFQGLAQPGNVNHSVEE